MFAGMLALGSSIGVGIASRRYEVRRVAHSWWGISWCDDESVFVGHDGGLLAASILLGVGGVIAIITALGLIISADPRRRRADDELRRRGLDLSLDVVPAPGGAIFVIEGIGGF